MKKTDVYIVGVIIIFTLMSAGGVFNSRIIIPQKQVMTLHFPKEIEVNRSLEIINPIEENQIIKINLAERELNIKDFGAKGDGLTDDTEAIQKAIDAASASKSILLFPESTKPYRVNNTLILKDNTCHVSGDMAQHCSCLLRVALRSC